MRFVAFGMLVLGLAGPAQAKYGWCTIQKDTGYDTYISAIIDIGNASDAYETVLVGRFGRAFQGYVGQFETIVREPDCSASASLSDAEYRNSNYARSNGQVIRTSWRGSWPSPGESKTAVASPGGAHLTVEPTTPHKAVEPILEAQNAAAAANAKRIADAARSEAAVQAQIAKFIADMQKRGRAQ